jgi:outer membrane protein assembly factor BamB
VLLNGVLYVLHDGSITAYNPATGATRWSGSFGPIHWQYPLVTHGKIFAPDNSGHVTAFKISGK